MEKRLQNILAHAGVASRRKAAELIERGQVKVDGNVVTEKGLRIDPDEHAILVSGKPISKEEKKRYFLVNKPLGMISTVTDTHGRSKIADLFKGVKARLYPVGRLDKDTTGLIIVTNDGDLANRLAHPRYEVEKEYIAEVKGRLRGRDIKEMSKGVEVEGKTTSPCEIKFLKKTENGSTYKVRIHEGRKRQVRVMFGSVGGRVIALKRTKYAGLTIGNLKAGEWRELTAAEVKRLKGVGKARGEEVRGKG